jgi:hypothetical protein
MRLYLAAMLASISIAASSHAAPKGTVEDVQSCAGYTIRTYRDLNSGDGSIEIAHGAEVAYERSGFSFRIGVRPNFPKSLPALIGQDLTASGAPHVVIYEWTGGAHCCIIAHVVRLGRTIAEIATINGKHSDPEFRPTKPGKAWEVYVRDWTFAYWPHSFAIACARGDSTLEWEQLRGGACAHAETSTSTTRTD